MKIMWNKVTWYSKFLALIVFLFAGCLGVYFWNEYREIKSISKHKIVYTE